MAIQLRRGLESQLNTSSLLAGEPAYCTDSKKLMIGRGGGAADLIPTETQLNAAVSAAVASAIAVMTELTVLYNCAVSDPHLTSGSVNNEITLLESMENYKTLLFNLEGSGTRFFEIPRELWISQRLNLTMPNLADAAGSKTISISELGIVKVSNTKIKIAAAGDWAWNGTGEPSRVDVSIGVYIRAIYGRKS